MSGLHASGWRHWAGFLVSGATAYVTDVAMSKVLYVYAGLALPLARVGGIGLSMVAGWLCHRRLTFRVSSRPTVAEFVRYAGMAWMAAALNYVMFLGLIWWWPAIDMALAIGIASLVAMVASYLGMRFAVFRTPE